MPLTCSAPGVLCDVLFLQPLVAFGIFICRWMALLRQAERDYDLNRAAELKYGTLIELQKQLKDIEDVLSKQEGNSSKMLREEVTEADVSDIISKWTGAQHREAWRFAAMKALCASQASLYPSFCNPNVRNCCTLLMSCTSG